MECLMVSRAFKKMINTLDHGSTKAKKVKTIGTYVERKGEQKNSYKNKKSQTKERVVISEKKLFLYSNVLLVIVWVFKRGGVGKI